MNRAGLASVALIIPLLLFAQGKPDLVVSGSVIGYPNPVITGNTVHIQCTILNRGTATAGTTMTRVQIKRNRDNVQFADHDFVTLSLPPGQSIVKDFALAISRNATPGVYTIYIMLDRYGAVSQSDTTNDYAQGAIVITVRTTVVSISATHHDTVRRFASAAPYIAYEGAAASLLDADMATRLPRTRLTGSTGQAYVSTAGGLSLVELNGIEPMTPECD